MKRLISKIWSPRRILCLGAVAIGVGCTTEDLPTEPQGAAASRQPAAARSVAHGDTVIRYIVRLKNGPGGVANRAESLILPYRGKLSIVFERVFQGFVAEGLTPAAAALLAKSPVVEYIEKEGFSYAGDVQTLTFSSQWGLDRIDQRAAPIDNQYTYTYTGAGVHIYIVDSGVRGDHVDFAGRMGNGVCTVSFSWGCSPTIDAFGHGTQVASQAAGTVAGVAKGATIHSVRIDDGDGEARAGDIVDGLEWVLQNHTSPAVVNLSYGDDGSTGGSFAVLQALQSLAGNGVVVVVSAGNHNRDAYLWRANRVSPGLVVAAAGWLSFDQSIYRMAYSNFGSTVDLFAPGDGTYAAINASSQAFGTFGGTSGASPFVAGAVAQILEASPFLSPADVEYWIKANSTPGVISGTMPGDPNLFLSRW